MGRGRPPKGATKAATPSSLDKKPIAKPAREKAVNKSYAEDSGSDIDDIDMGKLEAESPSPSPVATKPEPQEENSSEDEVLAPAPTKKAAPVSKRGAPAAGKSNANARASRDRASLKQSYKEDDSEDEISEGKPDSPEFKISEEEDDEDYEDIDDDDDFVAESSGSEYGKKKKTPAKKGSPGKGRGRGGGAKRGRKGGSASPKKRGRKSGSGTPSSAARSKNGRGRKRAADSDEEEEISNASDSDEEYVAKPSSSRGTKRAAVAAPRGGRKAGAAKPAAKKLNLDLSDEEEEEPRGGGGDGGSDEEEDEKPLTATKRGGAAASKKKATPRPPAAAPSRASARKPPAKRISYAEIDNEEDEDEDAFVRAKPAPKRAAPASRKSSVDKKPAVAAAAEPMDVDEEEEEEGEKLEAKEEADESSEAKEKPASTKKEEAPTPKPKAVEANGNGNAKAGDDDDEDEAELAEAEDDQDEDEKNQVASANGNGTAAPLKNRTETDWDTLDFGCDKKTDKGEPWNLKLASWNVGGVKAWLAKNGLTYLEKESPDVFCMQEIRCSEKTRPEGLKTVPGYPHCYWLHSEGTSGHHGVATFCKTEPLSVAYGLPIGEEDGEKEKKLKRMFNGEGRVITTEFEKFYLLNTYIPNSGRGEPSEEHKGPYPARIINGDRQAWDKFFLKYVQDLQSKKPVIVTGDLNVAHEEVDLANPATNKRTAGFTKEERSAFAELLDETGLCDSFRYLNSQKVGAYTFWSYRNNARDKNVGWRLDYFLVSPKIREGLCESAMRAEVYGSDHCPIVVWARV